MCIGTIFGVGGRDGGFTFLDSICCLSRYVLLE